MQTQIMHRLVGYGLVLVLAAGCYQSNGSNIAPTDSSQIQPTYTLPPSMTPLVETTIITVPQTLSPEEILNMQLAQVPTSDIDPLYLTVTAVYAGQFAPAPTPEPFGGLVQEPIDPIAITATFIVDSATQTASAPLTQAAAAAGIGFPTIEPTFDPNAVNQPQQIIPGADCIHEVRATDRNLYRISQNYGLTVDQVAAASGILNPDLIFVGQKLTIPGCGVTGARPLATSTPVGGIPANSQIVSPPGPGVTFTPIPAGGLTSSVAGNVHIVRQGETLFQISMQTGVPVVDIANANGISNINLIYLGQTLTIP